MHKIECCFINRLNGSDDVFETLEKTEGVSVTTLPCIGNCGICNHSFHAIVDQKRMTANHPAELYQKIMEVI